MKKTIYWAVTAKCGHVGGLSKYILITFYVEAKTKKEASDRVIEIPRVKHNNKHVILGIENISYDEYLSGIQANENDPYLRSRNIQEQRCHIEEIYDRILDEDDEWCINRSAKLNKLTLKNENRIRKCRYVHTVDKFSYQYTGLRLCTA